MKNSNLLISEFQKKKINYGDLQTISLHRHLDEVGCLKDCVDLILCDYTSSHNGKFFIKFIDVKDFRLGEINMMVFIQISISDISFRQMENINYKVTEEENALFSFYCESFTFEEITEQDTDSMYQ